VGLFGTITGLGLGMTLIRYRNEFSHWLASTLHIEIFPREVYQFSSIPAEVIPRDVAIICISAFFICSFAALIPASLAARLDSVCKFDIERRAINACLPTRNYFHRPCDAFSPRSEQYPRARPSRSRFVQARECDGAHLSARRSLDAAKDQPCDLRDRSGNIR